MTEGLTWSESSYYENGTNHYSDNTYTVAQWERMEDNGAVFFPTAGERIFSAGTVYGIVINYPGTVGGYWSSTQSGQYYAHYFGFMRDRLTPQRYNPRDYGRSVRLVRVLQD